MILLPILNVECILTTYMQKKKKEFFSSIFLKEGPFLSEDEGEISGVVMDLQIEHVNQDGVWSSYEKERTSNTKKKEQETVWFRMLRNISFGTLNCQNF